jgi:hypothetical protein
MDMDMQHEHGYVAWTFTCTMDIGMKNGDWHSAWTWTCTMDMGMQHAHGHTEWTWTWICSMDMDMHYGKYTCSMENGHAYMITTHVGRQESPPACLWPLVRLSPNRLFW